ncbi:MAG: exodeoxyribonuclease III, partial [Alphaproteobacteria bacterium]|nr:exodeoxyribonuclease III [Alphaproteobacteria bacterium]
MKIVTWNINSVRLRAPLVVALLNEWQPDVLCLQETKTVDETFPTDVFADIGYKYQYTAGMKSYNGQAILSKIPFYNPRTYDRCGKSDCRHISVTLEGSDIEVHNLYVPAGGDEPNIESNEKYKHKLDFVDELATWFKDTYSTTDKLVAVGDFNIAPYEHDVWSHKQLLKVISHTPPETEGLERMRASLNWTDVGRHFTPMEEKLYTWWSYRNKDYKKSNRGRRLDHVWVTPPLKDSLKSYDMMQKMRDVEKPSDHIPVMIEL